MSEDSTLERKLRERPDVASTLDAETVTSGNWWALLCIREPETLQFYAREYFSYYEFGSNFAVAIAITEMLVAIAWFQQVLATDSFLRGKLVLIVCARSPS